MPLNLFLIFFIVSLIGCIGGFKNIIHFMSVGYGFSVAALGATYMVTAILTEMSWSFATILLCILLIIYGLRLALFLLFREKNAAYQASQGSSDNPVPVLIKILMWISVSILYILQTSGIFYRMFNGDSDKIALPVVGALISITGLMIEALSDKEKTEQKAKNPEMVATQQLFKIVRCPNYFGEVLFWTGIFVSSLDSLKGAFQWITVILGYFLIVFVMFHGAGRLDKKQEKRYGLDPTYRAYADHTPIIIPLLPLHHIGNYKKTN